MKSQAIKEQARKLRQEGLSVRKIAKQVNCSTGTISLWTKDIPVAVSRDRTKMIENAQRASEMMQLACEHRRLAYQKIGRDKADVIRQTPNWKYVAVCMLFWAEGAKNRNVVDFSNTDPNMMKLFVSFLKEYGTENEEISITINCYLNNDLSLEEVQSFWINTLELPRDCLRKSIINLLPSSSKKLSKKRHPYGVCKLRVCDTKLTQELFGALNGFAGFELKGI